MARASTPPSDHDREQDSAIAEIYRQMVARDQAMWAQLTERDRTLQNGMMELFSRMLDNNSVDRVLATGFDEVVEQLKEQLSPLRDMTPQREKLPPDKDALLSSLRRALERPDFSLSPEEISAGPVVTDIAQFAGSSAS